MEDESVLTHAEQSHLHPSRSRLHPYLKKLWAGALMLCIAPFLCLTLFTHPFYDDYFHASLTLKVGVWGALKQMYVSWNGKYFSTLLLSLHPLVVGSFSGYKAIAFVLFLLTFISIYFFSSVLLKEEAQTVDRLIAASFFTALFCNQMPELTEGYYWMPGSITYLTGVIFTVFFFGCAVKLFESRGRKRLFRSLLSCLLIIAIVGSSETIMAIFFLLMLSITLKAFICLDNSRWLWLALLLLTAVCAVVVILAPGNAARSGHFPDRHRLFFSLLFSSAQEARFLLKWLTNPAFVLGTILFIPTASRLLERNELFKRSFNFHPALASLLLLLIVFFGFFPAYWSQGMLGQHRSVNVVFFLFLIGWFLNLAMWVGYLRRKFDWTVASLPLYVYVICLLLIPLSLLTTNNTREAIEDLASGRARRYDAQMKNRYSQIEQCLKTGRSPCPIDKLTDLPTTITSAYIDTALTSEEEYWKIKLTLADSR